ncbi:MAG: type II 3-dehydroquinate dehydratase [Candidatus Zixiibacteriota bacterium]|nr:MAG: type II 3-dehydroquinate dehydratase [candidate division Zixibacteria bacterium]
MKKIMVIHGPNLNSLGQRQPEIYGNQTLEQINDQIDAEARRLDCRVEIHQTNTEGAIVDLIQSFDRDVSGIIINPGGYSHTSVTILDALLASKIPTVEVHLSNLCRREEFRQTMITARGAIGVISGFGAQSYLLALQYLANPKV